MSEFISIILAFVVGLLMGALGGGGAILSMPVLVYLLHIPAVAATTYSLIIVGAGSLIGAYKYYKSGYVHIRTTISFVIPSLLSIYLTRNIVLPAIPNVLFQFDRFGFTKNMMVMVLFAILMIASSFSMILKTKVSPYQNLQGIQFNYIQIAMYGGIIGFLAGMVGAGGAFMIIPVLALLVKLPMRYAIGSTLVIVAINSFVGVLGDIQNKFEFNWFILLGFTGLTILGVLTGTIINKKINQNRLKTIFGWFVLLMGIYIIIREYLAGLN